MIKPSNTQMGDEILRVFSNGDDPETPFFKRKSSSHHHLHRHNKEQDRFLPIANVGRIMKKVIPGNGKISKDAKETVQECVSEFISFVTGEASDKCQREKRKTVNGEDVLWAITTLGFGDYVEPLKYYLDKYREIECEKLNVPKKHTAEQRLFHGQQHDQLLQQQEQILDSYSPANIPSQTSFGLPEQPFSLPFSDQVDSVCHW